MNGRLHSTHLCVILSTCLPSLNKLCAQRFFNRFVFVYLDDILIFSKSLQEHCEHVRQVLQHLLENKLYAKAEKCEFHSKKISFGGFIVEEGQVRKGESSKRMANSSERKGVTMVPRLFIEDSFVISVGLLFH